VGFDQCFKWSHVHTNTQTHVYTHTHAHTYTHTRTHTHVHAHILTHTRHARAHIHLCAALICDVTFNFKRALRTGIAYAAAEEGRGRAFKNRAREWST
jgi:hypothetical protein